MIETLLESLRLLGIKYYRILKINLTTDSFEVVKNDDEDIYGEHYKDRCLSKLLIDFSDSGSIHEADCELFKIKTNLDQLRKYFKTKHDVFRFRYRRKVGELYQWTLLEIIPAQNYTESNQELMLYVENINDDYTDQLERLREMELFCTFDTLTGLSNLASYRSACIEYKTELIHGSVGVIFADLNGLKIVNDTQGHDAGNQYILSFSRLLQNLYGAKNTFRMSGDEFVVILNGYDREDFLNKEKALFDRLNEDRIPIASVGYAWDACPDMIEPVVKEAELMMYQVKHEFYEKFPEYKRSALDEAQQMEVNATISFLAKSHSVLGMIDLVNDKYYLIKKSETYNVKKDSWSEFVDMYRDQMVNDMSKKSFYSVCNIENLRKKLRINSSVSHDFELNNGQWIHASYCRVASRDDEPVKVLFYSDLSDEDRVRHLAENEKIVKNYNILNNLCSSYAFIGLIDKNERTLSLYDTDLVAPEVKEFINIHTYDRIAEYFAKYLIAPEDKKRFEQFADLDYASERLKDRYYIKERFMARKSKFIGFSDCSFYFYKPADDKYLVFGIRKHILETS